MKHNSAQPLYKKVSSFLVLGLAFLAPFLVLPITNNLIVQSKLFLFFFVALLLAFVFTIATFTKKTWEIVVSPLTLPLVLFGLVAVASTFFTNQYPVQAVLGMGGVFISAVLIAVLGGTLMIKEKANKFVCVLGISAAVLSISSFFQMAGWGPSKVINQLFAFNLPHNMVFSLAGSAFVAAQVMTLALVGLIATVIISKKLSTLNAILIPLVAIGLAINVWAILPGKTAAVVLPPVQSAWTITLDSLRSPRAALIGNGPESYANVYSKFKPNWVNGEDYWQFNFASATNTPLTLIVTLGVLGVLAWAFLAFKVLKEAKDAKTRQQPLYWVLIATFVMQLLFPTNVMLLILQAAALAAWIAIKSSDLPVIQLKALHISIVNKNHAFDAPKTNKGYWFLYAGTGILMVLLFISAFFLGRAYMSYHYSYQANKAIQDNDAIAVFENQRKATVMNPYLDSNRRQYALTSLQIAIALSNNAEITPEERSQVVELVSLAINEGRAATVLNPENEQNWLALSEIYKNLIGTADEADQWAVNSIVSAVEQNPTNPISRIDLGNLFMGREQYEDAANFFNQAIGLKPDHPAGYFHLGRALVALQAYPQAQEALVQALSLVEPGSDDATQIEQALEQIKPMVEEATKAQEAAALQQQQQLLQQQAAQQGLQGQDLQQPQDQLIQGQGLPGQAPQGTQPPAEDTQSAFPPLTEQQLDQSDSEVVNNTGETIEL